MASTSHLKKTVLDKVDLLQTLGIQPAIAVRLIDLGKDDDAELDDYAELVCASPSLAAKLIAFANSSWCAPRQPVTTVKRAVGMIGMNQLRGLAVSYCLDGLHNGLKLDPEDAGAFWEASLCKGVAAKRLAGLSDRKRGDEAFAIGLLQDMGMGVLVSVGGVEYAQRLRDTEFTVAEQLKYEAEQFGMDHGQLGGLMAQNFGLPDVYQRIIAEHHSQSVGEPATDVGPTELSCHVAGWLSHDIRGWKSADLARFADLLNAHFPSQWPDAEAFTRDIQSDYDLLVRQLRDESAQPANLQEIVCQACAENAANMTQLAGQVQTQSNANEELQSLVDRVVADQAVTEHEADHDSLTGALNRKGFESRAWAVITEAAVHDSSVGLAFFDCDRFKAINDENGHDAGDAVLKAVVARAGSQLREADLICRWGGDEIVALCVGLSEKEFVTVARRVQEAVGGDPVTWQEIELSVSLTGGLRWVSSVGSHFDLEKLLKETDTNLLIGKKADRGALVVDGKNVRTGQNVTAPSERSDTEEASVV